MKKHEITIGGLYTARISGKFVTVRVDAIREYNPTFGGNSLRQVKTQTHYDVTNLRTGRKITFRSAAKFRNQSVAETAPRVLVEPMRPRDGAAGPKSISELFKI